MYTKHVSYPVRRISPADGYYFFGYYDLKAFNTSGRLHLAHKADFMDRLQVKGDKVQIGIIEIREGEYEAHFEPLDETLAWNFQQGAMLQWNPASPDSEIIYNSYIDGEYVAVIMNINTGMKRYLDYPVANVSPNGDFALGVNMSRLYDFRPGYGYAQKPDKYYNGNHPEDDGVFLIDLKTGKAKLIISLDDIWAFSGRYFNGEDQKININHITFNTEGNRFLFLARNFPKKGERHKTATITADMDGTGLFLLSDYGIQSHYNWKDRDTVIFFADGKELSCRKGDLNTYEFKDKTYEGKLIADGLFINDHHMSYSPGRELLLKDSYPSGLRMQTLGIYDFAADVCTVAGMYYSMPVSIIDIRCDLHPRWDHDGGAVSFDSTHEGFRGIYMLDLHQERK